MSRFTSWNGSTPLLACVVIALLAVGGSAIAGANRSSKGLSKSQVKKMVRKEIRTMAPKLSVRHAKRADRADVARLARDARRAERSATAEHAVQASTAVEATNAAAVNGVKTTPVAFQRKSGTASETILSVGGLTVNAACEAGGHISIVATTSINGASIFTSAVNLEVDDNNSNARMEDGSFNSGDAFDLLAGSSGSSALVTFSYSAPGPDSLIGTFAVDEDHSAAGACDVRGQVTSGFLPPP